MKKTFFIDVLVNKSRSFLLMMAVILWCRFFGQFLSTYCGTYSTNSAFKLLVWLFTPMVNISLLWGMVMLTVGYVMLIGIEYYFKKISN